MSTRYNVTATPSGRVTENIELSSSAARMLRREGWIVDLADTRVLPIPPAAAEWLAMTDAEKAAL